MPTVFATTLVTALLRGEIAICPVASSSRIYSWHEPQQIREFRGVALRGYVTSDSRNGSGRFVQRLCHVRGGKDYWNVGEKIVLMGCARRWRDAWRLVCADVLAAESSAV